MLSRSRAVAFCAATLLVAVTCSDGPTDPPPPTPVATTVEAVTPETQKATTGAAVEDPPGVLVKDQNGNTMTGVSVAFAVTAGGGAVTPSTVSTGSDGVARLTSWTLGTVAGTNTVTATASGLLPVTFSATGAAPVPFPSVVEPVTATSQQVIISTAAPNPPAVRVLDQNGAPMHGVSVVFAVTSGGGSVAPASITTGADGIARVTSWTVGSAPGTNMLTSTVTGLAPVTFTATGVTLPTSSPTSVAAVTATSQSAAVGATVTEPPGVIVRDQDNSPMQGVSVAFAVSAGGGSVAPSSVVTGSDGIARLTSWTLGANAGTNTVTATVSGIIPVTFTATGTVAAPIATSVAAVTAVSQSALVGAAVADPPGVIVRDQNNSPMAGVTVAFAVTAGGGSVAPASVVTGSDGIAQVTSWTLGANAGTNTVVATVSGITPITFTATGTVPAPVPVATTIAAVTVASQTALVSTTVPVPPGVVVHDQNNSPMPGVTVAFAVTAGDGSIAPSSVVTGSDGIARLTSWTLGASAGTNTVTASVTGLTPVTFTATGTVSSPVATSVEAATPTTQSATTGTVVSSPPGARVRDQRGDPMAGVTVAFAVTGGGGSVAPSSVVTGSDGIAQSTSWTLGANPGTNTVTATASSLTPVTFTATGLLPPPVATTVEAITVTTQDTLVNNPVSNPPGVKVVDQRGNTMQGVSVAFAVTSGGGSISPSAVLTASDGTARLTSWILGPNVGTNTVTATVTGLTPVTFTANGVHPPPVATSIAPVGLTSQDGAVDFIVRSRPGVVVRDQYFALMPGVTATFAVTAGGGTISSTTQTTSSSGIARLANWTLGSAPGTNTVTVTVSGFAPLTFNANGMTATCPSPSGIALNTSIGGTLGFLGCRLVSGEFANFYGFALADATAVRVRQSSTQVDAYELLLKSSIDGAPVAENDDITEFDTNSDFSALLAPGTYVIGASSFGIWGLGDYTLQLDQTSTDVTNCTQYFTVKGVNSPQTLSTNDCDASGKYADLYRIYLNANETVTIDMTSTTVDSYLVFMAGDTPITNDNRAAGTNDARITYTAPFAGYYSFSATSSGVGATGAYTLVIQ